MEFKHKLARRLAMSPALSTLTFSLALSCGAILSGCSPEDLSSPLTAGDTVQDQGRGRAGGRGRRMRMQEVVVSPASAVLAPGAEQSFTATARYLDSSEVAITVTWRASGGQIDSGGLYTAPSEPGVYTVVGQASSGRADSVPVTVEPLPTGEITRVLLSPDTASLAPGQSQAFTVRARFADGSTGPATVVYSATGGSVTEGGLYTAGPTSGSFHLIATAGGKADTSLITIGTEAPPAPPSPTLAAIVLAPESATLEAGTTRQFTVTGKLSDGSSTEVPDAAYTATGGTISAGGLYAAGGSAGEYRVIATAGALADTAAVVVTLLPPPPSSPQTTTTDPLWTGINANTGFYTDGGYLTQVNALASALGGGLIRMGMDGVGGSSCGAGFSWSARDGAVDGHRAAGLAVHAVIEPRYQVSGADMATRQNNWRCFVAAVMSRYKGKVNYYIIGNEPDIAWNGVQFTAAQQVEFTRIAYEESRRIAPDGSIKIESPPTTNPGSSYLRDMINLGVTRYADVLGVHSYGGQINDTHGLNLGKPFEFMAATAYPKLPVATSETGVSTTWSADGVTWQARWFRAAYVQHKRYGYDHMQLYSIRSTSPSFNFANWDGARIVPVQPTYDAIKAAYVRRPFGNGGFEDANDRELEWVIYWWLDQSGTPAEWTRAEFVRAADGKARTGSGYLRMDTGESSQPNRVRRVVEHLTPGRSYTATAWVRITGGGTATLKAQGFNHLNGIQEVSRSTTVRDAWQQLSVSFTPTKSWVVLGLEGSGTNTSGHVMYWDDVALSQ